jgi:hypothetical protein
MTLHLHPPLEAQMHEVKLDACTVTFLEEDLVHAHFSAGRVITEEEVQEMFDAIEARRGNRKVLLMVSVGEGTSMSNEARAFASSEISNKYIAADAIVVRDFVHQLAANVFVRHHKPGRPIKMFPDQESALQWLQQQRPLIDRSN